MFTRLTLRLTQSVNRYFTNVSQRLKALFHVSFSATVPTAEMLDPW